jgi:hypothetical protein
MLALVHRPLASGLLLLAACSVLDGDDGARSLAVTTVNAWTGHGLADASVRACPDDGKVHPTEWGSDCAVASGTTNLEGAATLGGLEAIVYQVYVEGPDTWGDHAQLVDLTADSSSVGFDVFPRPTAAVQTIGSHSVAPASLALIVGDADACKDNELGLALPAYETGMQSGDVAICLEIENNDFLGTAAFTETERPAVAGQCGDDWCPEWTTVVRAPRRRGTLNAVMTFEDAEIQADGTWLE